MKKKISRIMAMFLIAVIVTIGFGGKDIVFATNYVSYKTVEYTVNGVTWCCKYEINTNASSPEMGASYKNTSTYVTSVIGNDKDIVVPSEVKDISGKAYPLTVISASCFKDLTKIKSITINENITSMEQYAFSGCENLESFTLNTSVSIPSSCFSGCKSLKKIKLNSNNVGKYAFFECGYLDSVNIEAVGEVILGNCAFSAANNLKEVHIGEQVTKLMIGHETFAANTSLKELKFPCKTWLSPSSVLGCGALTKVEFCDEVTLLNPASLGSIPPAVAVPSFYMGVFSNSFDEEYKEGKIVEKEVVFHKKATLAADINVAGFFADCTGVTKVTFEEDAIIGPACFSNCKDLKELNFKKNVTFKAGNNVFSNCDNLKELSFHGSVNDQEDGNSVFTNSKIESLIFDSKNQEEQTSVNLNISNANVLEKVSFDVDFLTGSISKCDNLKSIIFKNNKELEWMSYGVNISNNQFKDEVTQNHFVYGYSSNDLRKCYTEDWCKEYSKAGTFRNIIDRVETYYDGKIIGEDATTKDID